MLTFSALAPQATKICNNLMLGISMIGASEALNLGIRYFQLTLQIPCKLMVLAGNEMWCSV